MALNRRLKVYGNFLTERINQIMKEKRLRQIDVLNLAKPLQAKYNIKIF